MKEPAGINLYGNLLKATWICVVGLCLVGLTYIVKTLHDKNLETQSSQAMSGSVSIAYSGRIAIENHFNELAEALEAGQFSKIESLLTETPALLSKAENWTQLSPGQYVVIRRGSGPEGFSLSGGKKTVPKDWNLTRFPTDRQASFFWKEPVNENIFLVASASQSLMVFCIEPSVFHFLLDTKNKDALADDLKEESSEAKDPDQGVFDTILVARPSPYILPIGEVKDSPNRILVSTNSIKFHDDYFKGPRAGLIDLPTGSFQVKSPEGELIVSKMNILRTNLTVLTHGQQPSRAKALEKIAIEIGVPIVSFLSALILLAFNLLYFRKVSLKYVSEGFNAHIADLTRDLRSFLSALSTVSDWNHKLAETFSVDFRPDPVSWLKMEPKRRPQSDGFFRGVEVSAQWQGRILFDCYSPRDLMFCLFIEAPQAEKAAIILFIENQISAALQLLDATEEKNPDPTQDLYRSYRSVLEYLRSKISNEIESKCSLFDIVLVSAGIKVIWQWSNHGWRIIRQEHYAMLCMDHQNNATAQGSPEVQEAPNWRLVACRFPLGAPAELSAKPPDESSQPVLSTEGETH